MVKIYIIKVQGTFLVKICDDAFNRNVGENVFKHIDKFLEVVGLIKISGLTQDRFRLSVFPVSLAGAASEWFTNECIGSITTWDNMVEKFIQKFYHLSDHDEEEETEEDDNLNEMDNVPKIFKIEGNLFNFETPLCEAFHEFNCLVKIDTDMFTYDIQNFKTYDEYERELNNDKAKGTKEPWSENGVPYQLCDHICEPYRFKSGGTKWPTCTSDIDGFCNGGELPRMVRVGSMTYFQDHRWYAELADRKLKDETLALKAKIKGSWGDATPGVIKFYGWKNEASNVSDIQENQGHKENKGNRNPEPSNCKIKRFEMMKYLFDDDEEYITMKESEYLNHSKDSLDAYRELLRLIDKGWVVTTLDDKFQGLIKNIKRSPKKSQEQKTSEETKFPYTVKVIEAYDAIPPPQVIIALPAIVPLAMFDSRDFFPPKRISPPKDAETPVESTIPISPSSSGRSSSPMPPKRTSTSVAPAMTQDAIRQLVADSVATALEAQAANMANIDKNIGTSGTPVARKGINDHKRKFDDRRNTTTNNDNNYSNNRNNNNYRDNHNNHNRNNDYHQQQNRRQETIRTYAATPTENKRYTKKYHGNLPLCTRCTLHHTGVCTGKCRTCNKVGHRTRNCKSKGPATGSNLKSIFIEEVEVEVDVDEEVEDENQRIRRSRRRSQPHQTELLLFW
ncbi:uncharacterized mitochondrial protein-like protein [Tanacetum coccineum]